MKKIIIASAIFIFICSGSIFSQNKSEKYLQAEELSNLNMYFEASVLLEELCAEDSLNFIYFQDLGYAYLNLYEYDSAIKNFTTATELNPQCIKCYSHLARAWFEKSEYKTAEEIINKAFALSDTSSHLYMTRGLIYQSTDRGDLALKDFTQAIKLAPDDADYYILRANYYLLISEPYNSYSDISSAIKINPENAEYYYYRAYILTNLKIHDEALIDIDKAIKINNNKADFYNLKFTIHMNRNQYNEAEQAVLKSIEIKPNDYLAYVSLGDLYFQISNFDRYCEYYQKAIALCPDEPKDAKATLINHQDKYCFDTKMPYYFVRILGLYNNANFGECINIATKGIEKTGTSAVLYNIMGNAYLSKGEYDLAEVNFEKCNENQSMLINEVKEFYSYPINDEDARRVADSYIVKADFGIATIKLINKDYDNALIQITKALDLASATKDFDGLEFLFNTKGLIYLARNDFENALKYFSIAEEKNPYNQTATLNKVLVQILKSVKYNPKKIAFEYVPDILCPRLIMPATKPLTGYDKELLNEANLACDKVIKYDKLNAYTYFLKAKIALILNDTDYCKYVKQAKEMGMFGADKELGVKCN